MMRVAMQGLGALLLVLGVIGVLTPIPFGIVFLVLSMLLLIPTTPGVADAIRRLRVRSPRVDLLMADIVRRSPAPYRRILRQTDTDSGYRAL